MGKVLLVITLAIGVGAPAVALSSGGARQIWVTNCYKSQYRPASIILACGDGTNALVMLKWSAWSSTQATGSGVNAVDTCLPSCAAGQLKRVAVTVTLTRPIRCPKSQHQVFDKLTLRFPGQTSAHRQQTLSLGCPIK